MQSSHLKNSESVRGRQQRRRRACFAGAIESLESRRMFAIFGLISDMATTSSTALPAVAAMVKGWDPVHIISNGDNNNDDDTNYESTVGQYFHEYLSPYDGPWGEGSPTGNRFWPVMGNHDWTSSGSASDYTSFFNLPGNERYYNVRFDNVEFFMLNSDAREPDGNTSTSTQGQWLQSALAASTATWKLVLSHHSPYTSTTSADNEWMRWPFKQWGASAVVTGHQHVYERLSVDGLPYIVNTTAGSFLSEFGTIDPNSIVRYDSQPGAIQMDAQTTALTFRFFNRSGTLIDTLTLNATGVPQGPAAPSNLAATAPTSTQVSLSWNDNSNNETGFKIERSPNGSTDWQQIDTVGANVTTYADTGRTAGTTYFYRVRANNASGDSGYSNTAQATTPGGTQAVFVPTNSSWKYLDNGSNQGTAWRASSFNDSAWASGAAQLGYGDGDEATVIGFGGSSSNKFITTYFRKSFSVADPALVSSLNLRLLRDDGAVVYLNGVEVFRSNMPTGTIGYTTRASSALGGAAESTFVTTTINPALLVAGANVFAVEIHQDNPSSSDISFDLELTGVLSETPPPQQIPAAPGSLAASTVSTSQINLTWADLSTDETGFKIERSVDGVIFAAIATAPANATSYQDSGRAAGTTYHYRVLAYNGAGNSAPSNISSATTQTPPPTSTANYILSGAIWKYLANGSNQGTAWRALGFSDTAWSSGASELGYGDGGEATVVPFGSSSSNKFITTYFRHSFNVADPAAVTALALRLIRDDGAVVYLNGQEVFRSNMPTGTISSTTLASSAISGAGESTWLTQGLNPALLVAGANVLAVEIHQDRGDSSDISFNAELIATLSQTQPPPAGVPSAPSAFRATALSGSVIRLLWTDTADDETGYRLERSTNGVDFTPIATIPADSASYDDAARDEGTQYWYRGYAFNAEGDSASSSIATATTPTNSSIPAPWQQGDIGTVAAGGNATFANGTFTVTGSGTDIGTRADGFRFVYQPWTGNGTIIARVTSVQNTNAGAKAGVMFRESLAAGAKQASIHMTPGQGIVAVGRSSTNGTTSGPTPVPGTAPMWLKLVRNGSVFTAQYSTDGVTWTTMATGSFSMTSTIYVGLAVTAKSSSQLNTSTFTDVSVSTSTSLTAPAPMQATATSSPMTFSSTRIEEEEDELALV